jgi:hypothetical protein
VGLTFRRELGRLGFAFENKQDLISSGVAFPGCLPGEMNQPCEAVIEGPEHVHAVYGVLVRNVRRDGVAAIPL